MSRYTDDLFTELMESALICVGLTEEHTYRLKAKDVCLFVTGIGKKTKKLYIARNDVEHKEQFLVEIDLGKKQDAVTTLRLLANQLEREALEIN